MDWFIVDVAYSTHEQLQEGITETAFRRFKILASDGDTASLIAAQWVAAAGVMPTRTTVCY